MGCDFNFPEDFKQKEGLSKLLGNLGGRIVLDSAFLSELQTEGGSAYHSITLIVGADIDPIPNEILDLVALLNKEHPGFRLRVYTENQLETGLSRGSLYFLEHCRLGTLLYASPDYGNSLDLGGRSLDSLLKRAVAYKKTECRKVGIFAKTADDLIKDGEYAMATFNLHQAFELSFRFVGQMCIGLGRVSHSIIGHIKYSKPFFPTLLPFSGNPDLEAQELLILLEHSYSGARYAEDYEVSRDQVLAIQAALERFLGEVDSIFQRQYDRCMAKVELQEAV